MAIRTDLAVECLDVSKEIIPEGVHKESKEEEGISITTVDITSDKGAISLGKPKGRYITVKLESLKGYTDNYQGEVSVIAEEISKLIPKSGPILVVGLGNDDITPDALGPFVVNQTLATRHITGELASQTGLTDLRSVAAIAPGVLGQTGMETSEITDSICKQIKPSAVLVIDALASRSVDHVGVTIQITDTGIAPGSGVQNTRKALNKETLNIPVIAIGVPTVVDMTTIAYSLLGEGFENEKVSTRGQTMMVTPREIDKIIKQASKTLGHAINIALQPTLSLEDIEGLTA